MNRALSAALAAFIVLSHSAVALAQGAGEKTPLKLEGGADAGGGPAAAGGGGLARTFVGLAIVIAVIYGVYWVLKQVKASREEQVSGSGLTALATLPLGPNRTLHLVRAGGEVLVVGAAEQGVSHIRTYTEEEARAQGLLDAKHPTRPGAHDALSSIELEAKEISSTPKPRLALPSALKAPEGKTAVETIRSWTVRG